MSDYWKVSAFFGELQLTQKEYIKAERQTITRVSEVAFPIILTFEFR